MTDFFDYGLKKFNSELTSDIQAEIKKVNELENEESIFDANNGQKAEVQDLKELDTNKDDKFNEEEAKNISAQIAEINAQADEVTEQITGLEDSAQNHDTQAASHHSKAAELRSQAANVPLKPEPKMVNGVATTIYVEDTATINALLNQAKDEEENAKKEEQQAKEDREKAADLANKQKEYFELAKKFEQDLEAYEDEKGPLKDELTDDKEKEEYEKQREVLDEKITAAEKEVDIAIEKAEKAKAEEEKAKEENEKNKQKEDNTLQPKVDNEPEDAIYLDDPSQNIVNKHPLGEENKQAYQLGDKRYYIDPKTGEQSIYQYDESKGYIPIAESKRTENGVEITDRKKGITTTVTDDGKIKTEQLKSIAGGGRINAEKPFLMSLRSDPNSNNMTVALNANLGAVGATTGADDEETDAADDAATSVDDENASTKETDNTSTKETEGEEKTDASKDDKTDTAEEKNDADTEEAIPSYEKAMKGDTAADDSAAQETIKLYRNDEKRAAIKHYNELRASEVKDNCAKGVEEGVKFDLDVFHDKYVDKKTHQFEGKNRKDAIEDYKAKVAADINATLKERYGEENLANVYEKIAENNADESLNLPKRDDYNGEDEKYIKEMSLRLAEISWDGTIENDFLKMDEVDKAFKIGIDKETYAAEANVTDTTEDADKTENEDTDTTDKANETNGTDETNGTGETNGSDESGKTNKNNSEEAAEEVTPPENLKENPDSKYGINENEDGTYTIASVEGLTPIEESEDPENLEDGEEHKFTKTDENGNKVNVTVQVKNDNDKDKTYTVTEKNNDGTTTETIYIENDNKLTISVIDKDGEPVSIKTAEYNNNGTMTSLIESEYTTNEAGDTICIVTDNKAGSYMSVTRENASGETYIFYDKDGKYAFDTPADAQKASKIIELYKDAGIDELTPSQKLILGEDKTLDELMKNIKNANVDEIEKFIEDNAELIKKVKNPSEDSSALELISDAGLDKDKFFTIMEDYDMFMGVYNNLSEDKKEKMEKYKEDIEEYFNLVFNKEYFDPEYNVEIVISNLHAGLGKLGIKRTSENNNGYETEIEYTAEYEDVGRDKNTYKAEETINTKTGSVKKTKTTTLDDRTTRTYEYENGKCIRRTTVKEDEDGNITEKEIYDDYHDINTEKDRRAAKIATIKYKNGVPTAITVKNNDGTETEIEYTIKDRKITDAYGEPIGQNSKLYQYIKENTEDNASDEGTGNETGTIEENNNANDADKTGDNDQDNEEDANTDNTEQTGDEEELEEEDIDDEYEDEEIE